MEIKKKDADEVMRGKRWSQIMYLYSLFGYKIDGCQMKNVDGKVISKENSYLLALGRSFEILHLEQTLLHSNCS